MEKNDTEDEINGSVLRLIGHDGHIIEQTLGEVNVHMTGVSVHLLYYSHPSNPYVK